MPREALADSEAMDKACANAALVRAYVGDRSTPAAADSTAGVTHPEEFATIMRKPPASRERDEILAAVRYRCDTIYRFDWDVNPKH